MKPIMSLKEKNTVVDHILEDRLNNLLPQLMAENNIEAWVLIGDEYNEGPCLPTFLPSNYYHVRKKMIFLFTYRDQTLNRYILSLPDFNIDRFYTPALLKPPHFDYVNFYTNFATQFDLEAIHQLPEEDQFTCLSRLLKEFNPKNIAIDISSNTSFSDGLSHTNYVALMDHLDASLKNRIISSEVITTRWLETRTPIELDLIKKIVDKTLEIVRTCYTKKHIHPQQTTIGDIRMYLMESAISLGMTPWFDATLWIRRKDHAHLDDDSTVVLVDDLLHCDFGVEYAGLCSDVQEMAYIQGNNKDLLEAYEQLHSEAMTFQDIVCQSFEEGLTGNEILSRALKSTQDAGIKGARLYTHPIGYHGHGAGPTIGQFSNQEFIKGSGEYPLHDATCYALELCLQQEVKALDNLKIMYGQEIDILFKNQKVHFFSGRQEKLHII